MTIGKDNGKSGESSGVVVVVGSLHYDVMVEATHRPEKGETVTGQRWYPKFGGKGGNQAIAAKMQGAYVRFVSATGGDNFADYLHDRLEQAGITTDYVPRLSSEDTGMSVAIQDAEGDYGAVIVSGANLAISPDTLANESLWENAEILLLQNEVSESINLTAARQARQRQITVCMNAAPAKEMGDELKGLIDIIVVNAVESQAMGSECVDSLESAALAAKTLSEYFKTAIVTAGGDGVAVCETGGVPSKVQPVKIEVVSTHGAGDVFTGTLCAKLAAGTGLLQAVQKSNKAAAEHVAA